MRVITSQNLHYDCFRVIIFKIQHRLLLRLISVKLIVLNNFQKFFYFGLLKKKNINTKKSRNS